MLPDLFFPCGPSWWSKFTFTGRLLSAGPFNASLHVIHVKFCYLLFHR